MLDTPKNLGFIMPAEWEEHSAIWLAWPYDKISFPKRVPKVEKRFVEIIKAIHESEPVELLILDAKMKTKASKLLTAAKVDLTKITFHITEYADIWTRDYGPMFINNPETHEQAWIKWNYNAYGEKFPDLLKDNRVFLNLRATVNKRMFEPEVAMEGGAIEVNGKGTVITTEQCLLNPNRNPGLSREQTETYLKDNLGADKIIWLKQGITNDHTDGHIDDVAKFVNATTILCGYEEDESDPNHKILDECYQTLKKATDQDGKPFRVVKMPMPHMDYDNGEKAPVSYCNFYIGNNVVLAPTFNDPNDSAALQIIQSFFPDRKVVGIDCTDLIYGGGAIHCMTQQQPAI